MRSGCGGRCEPRLCSLSLGLLAILSKPPPLPPQRMGGILPPLPRPSSRRANRALRLAAPVPSRLCASALGDREGAGGLAGCNSSQACPKFPDSPYRGFVLLLASFSQREGPSQRRAAGRKSLRGALLGLSRRRPRRVVDLETRYSMGEKMLWPKWGRGLAGWEGRKWASRAPPFLHCQFRDSLRFLECGVSVFSSDQKKELGKQGSHFPVSLMGFLPGRKGKVKRETHLRGIKVVGLLRVWCAAYPVHVWLEDKSH